MKQNIKRVCAECLDNNGSDIIIQRNNCNNIVLYDGKYYHTQCFIEMCNKKLIKRKNKKLSDALNNIQLLENNAKNATEDYFARDDVYRFIVNTYDIAVIPSYIWIKLNKIYSGELDGMTVGISPFYLYDMWKRQISNLNKIHDHNKTKGKNMDKVQRLNYDMSVLVNKYDSYLSWLEQQKILERETVKNKQKKVEQIDYQKLSNMNHIEESKDDIDTLLDELF